MKKLEKAPEKPILQKEDVPEPIFEEFVSFFRESRTSQDGQTIKLIISIQG